MRQILAAAAIAGLVAVGGLFSGCEDSPDTNNVDTYFDGNSIDSADDRPPTQAAEPEEQDPMAVSPASTTLTNNGEVVQFNVAGAAGSVSWTVQDISKGSILTQSSNAATYQRSAAGGNVVIATDSRGNAAFATVAQP